MLRVYSNTTVYGGEISMVNLVICIYFFTSLKNLLMLVKCIFTPYHRHIQHLGPSSSEVATLLKGKFPQTTMWIGWVESKFTNPTVKVWADLDNPLREVIMHSCVCRPLWMELFQNMWYHKRTTLHWLCT